MQIQEDAVADSKALTKSADTEKKPSDSAAGDQNEEVSKAAEPAVLQAANGDVATGMPVETGEVAEESAAAAPSESSSSLPDVVSNR